MQIREKGEFPLNRVLLFIPARVCRFLIVELHDPSVLYTFGAQAPYLDKDFPAGKTVLSKIKVGKKYKWVVRRELQKYMTYFI